MEQKSAFESFELNLSPTILGFLKETSTWTYFLSILGFVGIGLMVLGGLFFSVILSLGLAEIRMKVWGLICLTLDLFILSWLYFTFFPCSIFLTFQEK